MAASHLPGDLQLSSSSSEEEDLNISQLIRNLSTDLKESSPALIVNVLNTQDALRIWKCHNTEEHGAENVFCPDLQKKSTEDEVPIFLEKQSHCQNIENQLNCFKKENYRLQIELLDCKVKLKEIQEGLKEHSNKDCAGADILGENEAKKKHDESSDSEDEIASVSSASLYYRDGSGEGSLCSTEDHGSPPVYQLREEIAVGWLDNKVENSAVTNVAVAKTAPGTSPGMLGCELHNTAFIVDTRENELVKLGVNRYPGSRGTVSASERGRAQPSGRRCRGARKLASVKRDSDPGPSSAASKRSSQSKESPSRKRRRSVELGLVLDTVLLDSLVRDLIRHQDSWPFCRPVSLKEAPDYLEVVKRPMDLETIRQRLDSLKVYTHNHQVLEDIELVFSNCSEYNPLGSEEQMCGQRLELYYRQCRQQMSHKIPLWNKSDLSL